MFAALSVIYKIFEEHPLVCTDTRDIREGALFFALKGPNFNGNAFAAEALDQGCSYAIVDQEEYVKDKRYLFVPDVLEVLQKLANYHRRMLKTPIIALTGSNGKTTTKELISIVLRERFNVLSTEGNRNNHIGVPLTLLSLTPQHEMAVIEMGANHQGEIAQLCEIAEPDYGMITNIGKAHLEGFGGPEGVIKGKSEMYVFCKQNNKQLFVSAENSLLMRLAGDAKKITYGLSDNNYIQGKLEGAAPYLQFRWKDRETKSTINEQPLVETQLAGIYNFENCLAAVAIGHYFQIEPDAINEALASYHPTNSRSQLIEKGSNRILLDAYNANPTSMKAAIENYASMPWENKLLILGEMLELGDTSKHEHDYLLELLTANNLNQCFLIGKQFAHAPLTEHMLYFETVEALNEFLRQHPLHHTSILIKGSRGNKLEKVLEVL